MSLTTAELTTIRSWVGDTVSENALNDRYDVLLSVDGVIAEELRYQIAVMIDQPTQISLPGGLSVSYGENLRSLQERLKLFLNQGGTDGLPDPTGTGWARITRTNYR